MRVCGPSFAEFVLFMVVAADAKRETDVNLLSTHELNVFAFYAWGADNIKNVEKISYYDTSIYYCVSFQ